MNVCISQLFDDHTAMHRLATGLPKAFAMARMEMPKGNPAVGLIREHILTGFFVDFFGSQNVEILDDGTNRGFDLHLYGHPLSIKTVTANGEVKVLWTVDPLKIGMEISRDYIPESDLFIVNIFWGKARDSIFYIPVGVQIEMRNKYRDGYLNAKVGTNHRGIAISKQAMREMKEDHKVLKHRVNWKESDLHYQPHDRWKDFWRSIK